MSTFNLFADAGLAVPAVPLSFAQVVGGAPVDRLVYFGSPAAGKRLQAASNPGADALSLAITDSAPGSGLATTVVKLATSAAGLTSATGGAALALGSTILSGAANAVPVYVRVDSGAASAAVFDDLGWQIAGALESDV